MPGGWPEHVAPYTLLLAMIRTFFSKRRGSKGPKILSEPNVVPKNSRGVSSLQTTGIDAAVVDTGDGAPSRPTGITSIETPEFAAKLLREIAEVSDALGVLKGIAGVISRITTAILAIDQNYEAWKELGNVLQAQKRLLEDQLARLEWDNMDYDKTCPLSAPLQEYLV
ncbi:hypothetical protein FRC18_000637 [Serendipita sp. 400]|nr:hypothetical protein FRC18_000637 [Serendipita sp. 400]